jgi:hypothetical protein
MMLEPVHRSTYAWVWPASITVGGPERRSRRAPDFCFEQLLEASRMMNALSLRLRAVRNPWNPRRSKARRFSDRKPRLQVEGIEGRALLASITEFPLAAHGILPPSGSANQIVTGPDDNLWFTENDTVSNAIGRITPSGQITEFKVTTTGGNPFGITVGPDNNIWFAEQGFVGRVGGIGELDIVTGKITEFAIPGSNPQAYGITRGPDGQLWFTDRGNTSIGAVNLGNSTFHSPTVTAQTAVFLKTKKTLTGLQIAFSGHLDPATAANLANYQLGLIKKGHTRKSPVKTVPVGLSGPSYNTSTNLVTLIPPKKLKPGKYQLVILSSSSGGVLDASGQPLAGGEAILTLRV